MFRQLRGQTFIEYTLMIGALVMILVAMIPMVRRGIQAMVKVTADQLGTQKGAEQIGGRFGQMINSSTFTQISQDVKMGERLGVTSKDFVRDKTYTQSSVYLNQGFTEKDNP